MVKLKSIADACLSDDDYTCYYDRSTDSIVKVCTNDDLMTEKDEQALRRISSGGYRYLYIEGQDYGGIDMVCMVEFATRVDDDELRSELAETALGWNGERRFLALVEDHGLLKEWDEWLSSYAVVRAREWCEENGIPYTERSLKPCAHRLRTAEIRTRPRYPGSRRKAHARYFLKNASILSNGMAPFPPPSYRSV